MSGLLLDSNAMLWWLNGSSRLSAPMIELIRREPRVMVSVVSPWELGIKEASSDFRLPARFHERLEAQQFEIISPTLNDARLAASLPRLHKDPFDRMIVAQAFNRDATIVTSDETLARYGVKTIQI